MFGEVRMSEQKVSVSIIIGNYYNRPNSEVVTAV